MCEEYDILASRVDALLQGGALADGNGICMEFNQAIKAVSEEIRLEISDQWYAMLIHHYITVLGYQYVGNEHLFSPRTIETSPGVFCMTFNLTKDIPPQLQNILLVYMLDCLSIITSS